MYKSAFIAIFCLACLTTQAVSSEIYFIDAHSQVDEENDRAELIQRMDAAGVRKTILSSRRKRSAVDVADWAEQNPDRLIPSVRVKSKHYKKNTRKFYKKLAKQLKSGRFGAISEVLMYHAQKGSHAGEVIVYPDDARVAAVLEAAGANNWPLVMHIEFSAISGEMRRNFYTKMENLLSTHPAQAFCLIHMGQLDAEQVTTLIDKYKNIYFLTAHSNPVAVKRSSQPWVNMFQGNTLAPAWTSLLIKHPDRFIFAVDNVWAEHWRNAYTGQLAIWRQALQALPDRVAHAVAHGNAERLWNISAPAQ